MSAELNGDVDVGGQPFTLHAALDVGDGTKATVTATYKGTTTLADIAGLFGDLSAVSSSLSSSLGAISVGPASVSVKVGGGSSAFAFSATAHFTSPSTGHSIGATVLAVAKTGGGFTFGLKVDASDIQNLSDLVSGAPDVPIAINSGILVLASQDATLTKSQLTDEEFDFYKSLYGCAADTTRAQCTKFDSIAVTKGLKLEAGVELPESVEADAAKIGIPATGNLLISGQIPIFGGTTFSLTVELGNFRFDKQPDWFDHGAVSLTISTSGLKFSGDLGMRIRRQGGGYDETNCPDGSVLPIVWNDETQGSACYDKLDFVISVTIDYSNPAEPGIELAGVLQTSGGWHHAFGQSWLTVNHVALELGVKMTPTGPEVTLGFQGDIQVGSKDIEAAIKVGLATLQVPPFVRPDLIGFSLASSSGVALSDVVAMQKAVSGGATLLDTSSLPDVSIRNFFFQFSTENDSNLCLTQGLRFNGDLYVGSNLPTPDPPSVDGTGCRNFSADPSSPSSSCISHKANGCLASIGATIDGSGIRAKGELSGFTLGPLAMKDSSFHLNLTATEQSLFMSGGVKIASTSYTFAEGTATLEFSKDGFFFTGDAAVFNGAFHAYIQTSAPFDFTNPSFTLKVWLRADVNAAIQGALSQGLQAVKPILVGISQIVALFGQDGAAGILQNLPTTLKSAGVTVPPDIQKIVNGIADVAKQINDFGHATGFSLDLRRAAQGLQASRLPRPSEHVRPLLANVPLRGRERDVLHDAALAHGLRGLLRRSRNVGRPRVHRHRRHQRRLLGRPAHHRPVDPWPLLADRNLELERGLQLGRVARQVRARPTRAEVQPDDGPELTDDVLRAPDADQQPRRLDQRAERGHPLARLRRVLARRQPCGTGPCKRQPRFQAAGLRASARVRLRLELRELQRQRRRRRQADHPAAAEPAHDDLRSDPARARGAGGIANHQRLAELDEGQRGRHRHLDGHVREYGGELPGGDGRLGRRHERNDRGRHLEDGLQDAHVPAERPARLLPRAVHRRRHGQRHRRRTRPPRLKGSTTWRLRSRR